MGGSPLKALRPLSISFLTRYVFLSQLFLAQDLRNSNKKWREGMLTLGVGQILG